MKTVRETLLAEIDSFREAHDLTATKFGELCMGDPSFLFRLREGKDIRATTIDKVRRWMASDPFRQRRRKTADRPAA